MCASFSTWRARLPGFDPNSRARFSSVALLLCLTRCAGRAKEDEIKPRPSVAYGIIATRSMPHALVFTSLCVDQGMDYAGGLWEAVAVGDGRYVVDSYTAIDGQAIGLSGE